MTQKKIITVFGATGAQGGSLARAILTDPDSEFAVRALTRNPDSEKARDLRRLGAEVIRLDLESGYDAILDALSGSYGAFFVTFFWNHFSAERETREAELMARAAASAGIRHVIWSTLEDTRSFYPLSDDRMPTLMGRYKVPHFDGKGEADRFFIEAGVPVTFLLASFYWENFIYFGMGPKRGTDSRLSLTLPLGKSKLAGIAAEDIGKCAYGIFQRGPSLAGKRIGVAGEQLSGDDIAKSMSRHLAESVTYREISPAMFRSFGFPGADDLGNMFQFYDEYAGVVNAARNVASTRTFNADLLSFEQWLEKNASRIPLD